MKTMRRIVTILLAIVMVLSFAACGGSEKTVTLRGDISDQTGMPTTDTWTLTAKGDTLQNLTEVLEIDLSEYDDATKEYVSSTMSNLIMEPAKDIEGITCTDKSEGTTYTIEMAVDCTGDAVKQAVEAGILTIDGTSDRISLKQTQSALEGQGYEVVE